MLPLPSAMGRGQKDGAVLRWLASRVRQLEGELKSVVEQVVNVPRSQVVEKVIEEPKIQIQERIVKVPKVEQIVTHTVVQNQVQTTEMEKPKIIQKTVQLKKPIIQEHITEVTKVVEEVVPVTKVVHVPVEVPLVQYIDRFVDVPIVMQRHVPLVQKVQKTVEEPQVQYIDREVDVLAVDDDKEPTMGGFSQRQFDALAIDEDGIVNGLNRCIICDEAVTEKLGYPGHNFSSMELHEIFGKVVYPAKVDEGWICGSCSKVIEKAAESKRVARYQQIGCPGCDNPECVGWPGDELIPD